MSMLSRVHSRDQEIITITAADEWLGYCIADTLLGCHNRRFKVRALCRDKDKCERLRRKGAEVCEIDYDDRGTLDVGVRYSKWIVFVVEKEHDRVDKAEALCDAIKHAEVNNVALMSTLGTIDSDCPTFTDYEHIENAVKNCTDDWVILRLAFIQQLFYYWKKSVQEHSMLSFSIHPDSRFSPIHLDDVMDSFREIAFRGDVPRDIDAKHRHKIYTLTGPEAIDGFILADIISEAIDHRWFVRFMETSREQVERYLRSLGGKRDRNNMYPEGRKERNYPPPPPPNEVCIDSICDHFDYTRAGKSDYITGDVLRITGKPPVRAVWYFKENVDDFRPLKPTSTSTRSKM
ncbi:6419_t:CDS:2 [Paraglomus brasilianum]|uniref:6419_t:CDS:1 n=1 Tax=Paraglomus brasilianum TaxID=144538 RepID=A0A9N8ZAD9_9GLOM|nr:6419_t:CDS:2 [Paraglomus brasilianum]